MAERKERIETLEIPDKILHPDQKDEDKKKKRRAFLWFLSIPVAVGIAGAIYHTVIACRGRDNTKKYSVTVHPIEDIQALTGWTLKANGSTGEIKAKAGETVEITISKDGEEAKGFKSLYQAIISADEGEVAVDMEWDENKKCFRCEFPMPETNLQINIIEKKDIGYFFHTKDQYVYDTTSLCDSSSDILVYKYGQWEAIQQRFPRDQFNSSDIYVGNKITSIPESFLTGCSAFEGYEVGIAFDSNSTCTTIGNMFLANCSSFNKPITFPDSLKLIDRNFMHQCTSFNQPIDLNKVERLSSKPLDDDNGFLYGCTSFNSELKLTNIIEIPKYFMVSCEKFEQELELPSKIDLIADHFMTDTYAMQKYEGNGKLIVNCSANAFYYGTDIWTCSVNNKAKLIETLGTTGQWQFKVAGSSAYAFKNMFKHVAKDEESISHYRHVEDPIGPPNN